MDGQRSGGGRLDAPRPTLPDVPSSRAVVAGYLAVGALWILASDELAAFIFRDPTTLAAVQTIKGWLFVLVTASVLALLLARRDSTLARAARDVRRHEAAAVTSEQRFRAFMAHGPFEAFMKDDGGRYVYANSSFAERSGTPGGEWLGRSDRDLLGADEAATEVAEDEGVRASAEPREFVRSVGSGAAARTFLVCKFPVLDVEGRTLLGGVRIDVTDQQRSRDELARLGAAIDQAADTIMVTDADERILYANAALEQASGYERNELIGQRPGILRSGEHPREYYDEMRAAIRDGRAWSGDLIDRRRDGSFYELNTAISPVLDDGGRLVGWVQVGRNVSRERQLEAQLRQAQKMEAIGRLAGGIAHDFNNLLTAIGGYAELLLEQLPPDAHAVDDATEIVRATDRAAQLTKQLLAFGRRQVLRLEDVDLNAIIRGVVPMLRRLIGEDVSLVTELALDLGRVRADPGQLEQVLVNLAVNARDAMPDGGRLTIATWNDPETDGTGGQSHAVLRVADTGGGIDPEVLRHIFEPFFTTKRDGRGSGLGLATVYGIVQQSGGTIDVESRPGQGAAFVIRLPIVGLAGGVEAEAGGSVQRPSIGWEHVLVVEDEPSVRRLARATLERRGYRVSVTPDPAEALALSAVDLGAVDLLVTDVVMPGMSGFDLAERLRARRPDLPVLYISGYAEEALLRPGVLDVHGDVLAKPFGPDALAARVRDVLDAAHRSAAEAAEDPDGAIGEDATNGLGQEHGADSDGAVSGAETPGAGHQRPETPR